MLNNLLLIVLLLLTPLQLNNFSEIKEKAALEQPFLFNIVSIRNNMFLKKNISGNYLTSFVI
jgi:hypothetical protein